MIHQHYSFFFCLSAFAYRTSASAALHLSHSLMRIKNNKHTRIKLIGTKTRVTKILQRTALLILPNSQPSVHQSLLFSILFCLPYLFSSFLFTLLPEILIFFFAPFLSSSLLFRFPCFFHVLSFTFPISSSSFFSLFSSFSVFFPFSFVFCFLTQTCKLQCPLLCHSIYLLALHSLSAHSFMHSLIRIYIWLFTYSWTFLPTSFSWGTAQLCMPCLLTFLEAYNFPIFFSSFPSFLLILLYLTVMQQFLIPWNPLWIHWLIYRTMWLITFFTSQYYFVWKKRPRSPLWMEEKERIWSTQIAVSIW